MNIADKDLIIFDLDGTLSPSKMPMDAEMGVLIGRLIRKKKVAVISGDNFAQYQTDILQALPPGSENLNDLILLPTSGASLYAWKGNWAQQYSEGMTEAERKNVMAGLNESLQIAGFQPPQKIYGEMIEDRGAQITFSANGQRAPLEVKSAWDPDRKKREKIVAILQKRLPQFDLRIGGTNSIDITKRGINKGYGIRKLEEYLKMPLEKMVFIGDKLMHGGNDYPARATGVDCIQVSGPEETKKLIEGWLA